MKLRRFARPYGFSPSAPSRLNTQTGTLWKITRRTSPLPDSGTYSSISKFLASEFQRFGQNCRTARPPPIPMQSRIQHFVAQLPQLLPADWSLGNSGEPTLAVVIDTLRFTSTVCVALQAGADSVCVAAEVEAARTLASELGIGSLLCGERLCHRIEGFQLGNSPFEYTPAAVAKRALVFSTTNGTRAVTAAEKARQVILASLLNRAAIVDWIVASRYERVWFLCAGTDGQIAAEDVLTAGAILSGCQARSSSTFLANDSATIAVKLFESQRDEFGGVSEKAIVKLLSEAAGGLNLIQSGYSRDLIAVAQLDTIATVPRNCPEHPTRFRS